MNADELIIEQPDDLKILADLLEDASRMEELAAVQWLIRNRRWPLSTYGDGFIRWWLSDDWDLHGRLERDDLRSEEFAFVDYGAVSYSDIESAIRDFIGRWPHRKSNQPAAMPLPVVDPYTK